MAATVVAISADKMSDLIPVPWVGLLKAISGEVGVFVAAERVVYRDVEFDQRVKVCQGVSRFGALWFVEMQTEV